MEHAMMTLALPEGAYGHDYGSIGREPEPATRLGAGTRLEAPTVDSVRNHPNAVHWGAELACKACEGVAHCEHAARAAEGVSNLAAAKSKARDWHLRAAKGHGYWHPERPREKYAGESIRVSEVCVDQIKGECPAEPGQERKQGQEIEEAV